MDRLLDLLDLSPGQRFHTAPFTCLCGIFLSACLVQASRAIVADYRFFLSLGPGGTPANPAGYLRICLLRLITIRDPLEPPVPFAESSVPSFFKTPGDLPRRKHSRPQVAGIAPHRQLTQRAGAADIRNLHSTFYGLSKQNRHQLQTGKSFFEKHSLAIFLASSQPTETPNQERVERTASEMPQEIAHLHGCDGSLHLTLHPGDVKTVLEKGWGERHPLAGRWLPAGFVLVYAPRGKEELGVVVDIIRASGWWVSRGRVNVQP